MDVREKLVELLENHCSVIGEDNCKASQNEKCTPRDCAICLASNLIANCVTVQELDGCIRCKDSQQMTVTISNKLVDGVNTGWLGGNLPARFCPFCGRRLPQPPKGD